MKTALTCGSAACIYTVHRNTHVEEHPGIPRNRRNTQDDKIPEQSGINRNTHNTQEHPG